MAGIEIKNSNESYEVFDVNGDIYHIPLDKVDEAFELFNLIPGWYGMYIKEFAEKYKEYLIK